MLGLIILIIVILALCGGFGFGGDHPRYNGANISRVLFFVLIIFLVIILAQTIGGFTFVRF